MTALILSTCDGHATTGTKSSALYVIVWQYSASSSPYNQSTSAKSTLEYSAVFSSGAKSAAFAPASIAIFDIVILAATLIPSTVLPENSNAL